MYAFATSTNNWYQLGKILIKDYLQQDNL